MDDLSLELVKISNFPESTDVKEWVVVSDAMGNAYKVTRDNFKAFLGTVQVTAPKPLSPTDPAPTLDGVYIPTVTQNESGTPIVYTNAGGLTVNTAEGGEDYGKAPQLIKNDSVWVKSSYPLPRADNILEAWTARVYSAGSQVSYDGMAYEAISDTLSTDVPSNISGKWKELLYFMKAVNSPVEWGYGDENGNVLIYVTADGLTHLTLAEDSYPATGLAKSITSNIFDLAFIDSVGENIILGVTKEGELFPRQETSPDVIVNDVESTYEDESMYYDVSKDGIWNQWIEPQAVVDNDGNLWFGSVGSKGNLYVSCRYTDGRLVRRKIGEILTTQFESDDHNSPSILLDNRPEAEYPIMIFQCDHNTTPLRYWRFETMDINEWDVDNYSTIGGNVAYSESWRYNDEIFVFSRDSNGNRPWRMAYSSNNGNTWSSRVLFDLPAHWLYCLGKVKEDGSGVNIIMYGHPLNSLDQSIYFLELDFASGAVINPANRSTPVIANIRTAIANPSFVPLIVPNVALKIYEAAGTEITRMWDISRDSSGDVAVVFNSSPSAARTMSNFNDSLYKVVKFSLSNGSIIGVYDLEEAGMPIENPKGNNMYFAGASLIDSNRAIISTWKNQSQIDGGNDVSQDYGKSEVRLIDFSNPLVLNKKLFAKSDLKLIRPYVADDFILLNECKYFITYDNFYSNVIVTELENI